MIDNLDELIDAIAETTREHVAKEIAKVRAEHAIEIADLRAKLSAALTRDDLTAEVAAHVAQIEKPKDGRSVTTDEVEPLIEAAVEKRVALIQAPKAEEVDYDRIGEVIAIAVDKAFTSRPWPKDVDMGVVTELVKAAAITAVADLPKPEVKSIDPAEVRAIVESEVERRVVSLPKPEPVEAVVKDMIERLVSPVYGALQERVNEIAARPQFDPAMLPKSVSSADVAAAVAETLKDLPRYATPEDVDVRVKAAIAEIPQPTAPDVDGAVARALSSLPRYATPEEIGEKVTKAIDALPAPISGLDVAAIVEHEVAGIKSAIAALPPPVELPDIPAEVARAVAAEFAALPSIPDAIAESVSKIPRIKGDPGRDFDPEILRAEVERAVSASPPSIDEEAIVERVLARIPVPKDGEPGKDGESIHPDTVALMVRETVEKAIAGIRMPEDGKPGRDALDVEIVEALDATKSYPVGTFALHRGGMVMAERDTDALESAPDLAAAGWKVTQEGIASIRAEPVSDLKHRIVIEHTSGATESLEFVTSFANIDKGVYRPGMKYQAGFGVTHDMGFWIAKRDTDKMPPHDDWRLAIKGKFRP